MKYTELTGKVKEPIFSIQELKLLGLKVIPSQLSFFVKAGQLLRLKNGLYAFANQKNLIVSEAISFRIYEPSYISLEWALHYYGFIPEMVYNITSITTKTTRNFKNVFGVFIYRNIKPNLFWGYEKREKNGQPYLIAEPEKALLDYLYFNLSRIKTASDFEELRLNISTINALDINKLLRYADLFENKRLVEVVKKIIKQ
jgi:predicted transcriptional regulator of viral defense system